MSMSVPSTCHAAALTRRLAMSKSSSIVGSSFATAARAVVPAGAFTRPARAPRRQRNQVLTSAGWNDFEWGSAKVVSNAPACAEGGLHSIVLQVDASMAKGYATPGMFVQMRTAVDGKAAFIAVASAPDAAADKFEFLVKSGDGTAGELCALKAGADVGVSPVMGKGFDLTPAPAAECPTALLFATGSGISPIRALVKSGALAGRDVTLYYGTRSPAHTAFKEEVPAWEAAGVKVVMVHSQEEGGAKYIQDALKANIENVKGGATCAVLVGQKGMTEAVIEVLTAAGVPKERCIMNF